MAEALKQQNESLHGFVQLLQSQMLKESAFTRESPYFQPVSEVVWEEGITEDFRLSPLTVFDDLTDHEQHIRAMDEQAGALGDMDTLKCGLTLGTLKDEAPDWYMSLPRASVSGYPDLVWKMNQSFSIRKQWESPISTSSNNPLGACLACPRVPGFFQ